MDMGLKDFKKSVLELKMALANAKSKGIDLKDGSEAKKVYDFNKSKDDYYRKAVKIALEQVKKRSSSLLGLVKENADNEVLVTKLRSLVGELDVSEQKKDVIVKIMGIVPQINVPEVKKLKKAGFLPAEIKADVNADIDELNKAFNAGCYRSAAILCGRILEVALHRKYFEATGVDLLEKSPGIGLGKIVAKLSEKNITLDPGITQQIHLINNVRISSVHVKQQQFTPSKAQTEAMILYTLDILEKIFAKND
jgi:hypothetical protein